MRIIYCYTNKINNKKYVGQTNNPESYPIRTLTPQKRKALEVKDFLLNTEFRPMEIARMVDVSLETIRRINLGITNKDEKLDYPLRNL